jgi:PAS domain S-box-containing protein
VKLLSQTKKEASAKEKKCKDAQETLQKENTILQEMLNETENMHVVFLDRDFNFVRVNEAYAKTCGYKPDEMIGKNHFDLYPNEENEAIFRRVRDTGVLAEFHDKPFVFPDQPERGVTYWDWTLKPIKNEAGEVEGLVLSLVETTKRKRAEEALRASGERHRVISDITSDFVFSCVKAPQKEFVIDWMAGATEKVFGYSASEIRDKRCWRFTVLPQDLSIFEEKVTGLRPGQSSVSELRVTHKDGSTRWLELVARVEQDDSNPRNCRLFGACRDITERKKAEEELNALNEELEDRVKIRTEELASERKRLYDMLENLPVMVRLFTPDYKIAFANRAFREKFGEHKSRRCYESILRKNKPCAFCEAMVPLKTGKPHHWISRFPNGTVCETFDFPFTDVNGSRMILEADIDITERINLEKQLKNKERLAVIGATAGMVGHDIRNPLQAIFGDLYLLASDMTSLPEGEQKESMEESVAAIKKNAEYIDKIVQDLQVYAKPLKPTFQEIDVEALFQEVLFKEDLPENVEASYQVEGEAKNLKADPELLKRILSNLVINSVQAMPEGGKLEIHGYRDADVVVISVEDNGVGIPEEVKSKLFTPLFTTKAKGQGFGLAVVKRLTEALGGTVTFESEEGKGTKFIVRLPTTKK